MTKDNKPHPSGFLNLYKPLGVSSAGILNTLKREMGIKKIGHGGTLDPMAEGVLPVAIGTATRFLRFLPSDKKYVTTVLLGMRSDTDDLEGELTGEGCNEVDEESLNKILDTQRGKISQMVPTYSAVHVNGRRLYKMARSGNAPVELPTKDVEVFDLELLDSKSIVHNGVDCWQLQLSIHCSAGTYIRSIARDIGEALGCGGCMSSLKRTFASGLYADKGYTIETLKSKGVDDFLVKAKDIVNLKMLDLDNDQWYLLKTGRPINLDIEPVDFMGCIFENRLVAVIKPDDDGWRSEMVISNF